jgi:hypothetical protein
MQPLGQRLRSPEGWHLQVQEIKYWRAWALQRNGWKTQAGVGAADAESEEWAGPAACFFLPLAGKLRIESGGASRSCARALFKPLAACPSLGFACSAPSLPAADLGSPSASEQTRCVGLMG